MKICNSFYGNKIISSMMILFSNHATKFNCEYRNNDDNGVEKHGGGARAPTALRLMSSMNQKTEEDYKAFHILCQPPPSPPLVVFHPDATEFSPNPLTGVEEWPASLSCTKTAHTDQYLDHLPRHRHTNSRWEQQKKFKLRMTNGR